MSKKIAYLCAEFAVDPKLPIFAGGLGVLAADVFYQAGDLGIPLVGVTLFYAEGCFNQRLDEEGNPHEECVGLNPQVAGLVDTGVVVEVPFPNRTVHLKVWKKEIGKTPLYLLDTDIPENSEQDRTMAYRLYDGRVWPPRIECAFLLGVGGVRALRRLGEEIAVWHLNDDHAGFSLLERIRERVSRGESLATALAKVKEETVYTTHTQSLGAESVFALEEARPLLENLFRDTTASPDALLSLGEREREGGKHFSLTVFAMRHSRMVNAVSQSHLGVSRNLWGFVFPSSAKAAGGKPTSSEVPITHITNGIYPKRWVAAPLASLYTRYLASDWDQRTDDPALWGRMAEIPDGVFWEARQEAKKLLTDEIRRRTGRNIDPQALIFGFARRFTKYKQPTLPLADRERLATILTKPGQPAYLVMSGKVHPRDTGAVELVRAVAQAAKDPIFDGHLIFLENYGLDLASLLVSGSDVWLNTPAPGNEACGTSGMKALYNGVLHASTLDGWWVEASNGRNGWEIKGPDFGDSLYGLIETEVVPLYYRRESGVPKEWLAKVKDALADLAPRYNTRRMLREYKEKVYWE